MSQEQIAGLVIMLSVSTLGILLVRLLHFRTVLIRGVCYVVFVLLSIVAGLCVSDFVYQWRTMP